MFTVHVEWLDDNKSRVRFSLPGREEWKAEHITALIGVLAQIRGEMAPAVPVELPLHQCVEALHDPRYATQLHEFSGGTVLDVRHPALGWLEFVLPCRERDRMAHMLAEQQAAWQNFHR